MSQIYIGQTALRVDLAFTSDGAALDITGATVELRAETPTGGRKTFNVLVSNAAGGLAYWEPSSADDLDEAGVWKLWGHVTFSNGDAAAASPTTLRIYEEGR